VNGVDLASRIAQGSWEAEEELVRRFARGVAQAVLDQSVVEDFCQDTFRIAIENVRRGQLRDINKIAGFLCGIARNLAIAYHRRPTRVNVGNLLPTTLADTRATPLETLLREENAVLVRTILSGMNSERDREILCRFYLLEHPKERICEYFGPTTLHFKFVLFRATELYCELHEMRRTPRGMKGGSAAQ
jgi:DNA-directed RNA polymerase specialized sigma24 family protein